MIGCFLSVNSKKNGRSRMVINSRPTVIERYWRNGRSRKIRIRKPGRKMMITAGSPVLRLLLVVKNCFFPHLGHAFFHKYLIASAYV
jgi:hypothetical protein